jgi:hypothetical protein
MVDEVKKSFWQRPEGTTGMLALAAGAVGLYFALPALIKFVDMLTTLLGETLMLGALGVAAFLFLNIVFNKKVQLLVKMMFKSAMRAITQWFVEIDPIGIMLNYVDGLKKKLTTMEEGRAKLRGQIRILENKIKDTGKKYDDAMSILKVANDQGKRAQVLIQGKQAGRMQKLTNETLAPLLTTLNAHKLALDKYYEVTQSVIEDTENEVEAKKIEREAITSSYNVLMTAKKILNGGTDEKELFDQAMDYVVEDLGMKVGAIEDFLENSKGMIDSLDMQNGVYSADALARLEEWNNKADDVILGKSKAQLLENNPSTSLVNATIVQSIGVPSPVVVDYSEMLNKR